MYLRGWPCGNQPISEALAQAACGLSGWHARNAGGVFALGPDYLSVLSASLMCTTGVAALIGQYRGSGSREVNLSLGGVGLLSMAQYLAMDDAGQASPSKAGIDWSSPPFISVEGHLFELEALSPEAWLSFGVGYRFRQLTSQQLGRPSYSAIPPPKRCCRPAYLMPVPADDWWICSAWLETVVWIYAHCVRELWCLGRHMALGLSESHEWPRVAPR